MPTLISIVSEQTLPNVLLIKQLSNISNYYFITSNKMEEEGRTNAIVKVCGIKNEHRIVVEAENREAILQALRKVAIPQDEPLILHLTGGTKIMALAAYQYFTTPTFDTQVIYKPLREDHFLKIFPDNECIDLTAKVNLEEYLHAYGVEIISKSHIKSYKDETKRASSLMEQVIKGEAPTEIVNAFKPDYTLADKSFLTGAWFELWLASRIKSHFKLSDNDIAFNVELTRAKDKNQGNTEYDVMYVRNNRLYIAECKYFWKGGFRKQKINKDWYKLAGLQLQMGLYATPFLIVANDIPKALNKYLLDSHKLFRIKDFAGIETIKDETKFEQFLNQL